MVGYYGNIIFETSDKRILTFTDFKHDSAARWEKHNVIGKKPVNEFIGPDLDTITFTVNLNGNYGVKPRDEMEKWIDLVNKGSADILVIGTKAVGQDKWSVKSVSEVWGVVFNRGELFSGKIDVTLEEYIESIEESVTEKSTNVNVSSNSQLDSQTTLIKQVQHDLQKVSCLVSGENNAAGKIDDKTKAAVKQFRYIVDLPVSDSIDSQLIDALNSITKEPTIGYGWPPNSVAAKFIQWWIGISPKNGLWDLNMVGKVKAWQVNNGIWSTSGADGVIRKKDWNKILR